ncbi:MAG: ATP-binding cassette domain-containing protein [Bacillota bacterium]
MNSIEIKSLSKRYGTTLALDSIDLCLQPNRIYGLLGRNGAGKTTLLNLITNRIFPTTGEVLVAGQNVQENDQLLGQIFYMTEADLYPPKMRVKEGLSLDRGLLPGL